MSVHADAERERIAKERFDSIVRLAIMKAGPISHWGDGSGGYLIERFTEILREFHPEIIASGRNSARRKISNGTRQSVFERDHYRCVACGTHIALTIDHKIPVSLGGSDDEENLQTMCLPCNMKKGASL